MYFWKDPSTAYSVHTKNVMENICWTELNSINASVSKLKKKAANYSLQLESTIKIQALYPYELRLTRKS